MEIRFCYCGLDLVRLILDGISGLVVDDNSSSRPQGASLPLEILAESGSSWLDSVIVFLLLEVSRKLKAE